MSWRGHGASPARREERKKLREARVARNRAKRIQAEADRDTQRKQDKIDYWDRADLATRRGRTSRKAKEARRKQSKRVPFVGQQWRAGGANIVAAPPGKSKEEIFADEYHAEQNEREAAIIEQLVNEGLITRNIA
tara:strand:+ start:3213 stop:3617 length:405 start_codon:yes stop_codon:yes gene_type:complete